VVKPGRGAGREPGTVGTLIHGGRLAFPGSGQHGPVGLAPAGFVRLVEETLEFRWHAGAATPVEPPHDTGWRTLPYLVTAYCDAYGQLEVAGSAAIRRRSGAIWVPAGTRHRCALLSGRGISRWSCTSFTIAGGLDLCALFETPFAIAGAQARRVASINDELAELAGLPPTLKQVVRRQELGRSLLLIGLDGSLWRPDSHERALAAQRLAPVLLYIEANLARPLRVAELARRAELSPSRFHAWFQRATGSSPYAYLLRLRLRRAQELMIGSTRSIAEVAEDVGYPDQFLFSRTFRRKCGLSPTAYRTRISHHLV
jgi:AraC-like DNA-binding protein